MPAVIIIIIIIEHHQLVYAVAAFITIGAFDVEL